MIWEFLFTAGGRLEMISVEPSSKSIWIGPTTLPSLQVSTLNGGNVLSDLRDKVNQNIYIICNLRNSIFDNTLTLLTCQRTLENQSCARIRRICEAFLLLIFITALSFELFCSLFVFSGSDKMSRHALRSVSPSPLFISSINFAAASGR